MRINDIHGEGIVKSKRGGLFSTLGKAIVLILVLGVVIYFIMAIIRPSGENLGEFDACLAAPTSNMKGITGRCFPTKDCGGKNSGWENPLKLACSKEKKYCCQLSDPDTYYPPGTLEVQLTGDYQSTFRVSENPSSTNSNDQHPLKFEVGKSGTEEYATKGLPKKAPLFFRYRPKSESTEKCTLTYGGENKVKKTFDCSISDLDLLNKEKLDYNQLSGGGHSINPVSIQITEEPATKTTTDKEKGTPSTSSTPQTVEYKIPFDLGG